jgi:hypothetical protein
MLEIYYLVYFIFLISILAILLVWNSNLHKNPKFSTILNLITFSLTQADKEISLYEDLFDELIGETITTFENDPTMNYFYNQMFRPLHYNPKENNYNRNYSKEQQIVHFILQKTASIVYLLNNDTVMTYVDKESIKQKLESFYKNIIRSHIFIQNYKNIKPQIFNQTLKRYLQVNFNI